MKQLPAAEPTAKNYNKPAYVVFVAAALVCLGLSDFSQAAMYCSLALAFDPFDTALPWEKRPFYQKAWLYSHAVVSLAFFALMLLTE